MHSLSFSPSVSLALSFSLIHRHTDTHTPFCEHSENFHWWYTICIKIQQRFLKYFYLGMHTCKHVCMHVHTDCLHINANHQDIYLIFKIRERSGHRQIPKGKEPKGDGQDYRSWCMKSGFRKSCFVPSMRSFDVMAMSKYRFQIQVPKIRFLLLI